MAEKQLGITEKSQVTLDVKSLIGILAIILSIAGVYFTLTGQLSQLQLDLIRMKDDVGRNTEFTTLWPRGELGALPDDAVQDLNISYLQKEMEKIQAEFDEHIKEHHAGDPQRHEPAKMGACPKTDREAINHHQRV